MKVFALVVSRLLEPIVLFPLLFFLLLLRSHMSVISMVLSLGVVVFVMLVPSVFFVIQALKRHTLSNWDMSIREERVRFLPVIFSFLLLGVCVLWVLGMHQVMQFCLFVLLVFFGFVLITFWFKISGHMIVATACMVCLSYWYPQYEVVFLSMIPLLAWSRVTLKRHTVLQVLTGCIYGGCVGYISILSHLI